VKLFANQSIQGVAQYGLKFFQALLSQIGLILDLTF
jgi:hypothetical protein